MTVTEHGPEGVIYTNAPTTIHQAMAKVLADLPAIGKNQRNTQQNYQFRGIDDVLDALNPVLAKHGVFFMPTVIERTESTRQTQRGGTMWVVNLHVRYTFYGPAGDTVVADAWGEGTDSGDKATQKAMTSALKYVLFQVFAIATHDRDADSDSSTPEDTDPMPVSSAKVEELKARCIVLKNFGVNLTDHRHRWRLPILDASDNADLAQWEAMLKQLEDNLDAVTNRPTKDVVEQAGDVDGPIVREEPDIGAVETEDELRARIEAEVAALQPIEVRKELDEGKLELTGGPKILRERLVAYKVWCALGQEELPPADPSPQEVLVAEEML